MSTKEEVELPNYSHPDQPVRHSYPLAIPKAGIGTAFGLLMKTLPYALARFGVLLGFSVATILWIVLTFGVGLWLVQKVAILGWIWLIAGLVGYSYLWWFIVRYFLYLLKAGHIAVLTEFIVHGKCGSGEEGMFRYGKDVVQKNFGQVNILFALDLLIKGVVRAFNRTLDFAASLLPVPGVKNAMAIVNAILRAATTYIDETIFSYSLARGDKNRWRSSQDGLIYYCQNPKEILKTAVWVVVLDKVLTFLIWLIMLAPAFGIGYLMPESMQAITWVVAFLIAALFAWNLQAAFLHPLFLILMMVQFHATVQGQEINATWDERLSNISGKFRKIKEGAQKEEQNQQPISDSEAGKSPVV